MKKIAIFLLVFTITLHFMAANVAATGELNADTSITSCYGIDANSSMLGNDKITENARAAFLYEANSQTVMYADNADQTMFPASLVKILTALLAIEQGSMEDVVIASDSALSSVPYDAVSIKLQVGEQMKLLDLLYSMIVGSANDSAAVIAEHISGNQDEFVAQMNQYAQKLGCTGTNFVNVHGLHDEQQVTTARDVARILEKALQNETFRQIFTTKEYIIEATNMSDFRKVKSNNDMLESTSRLYYDSRVIGGRSGVTEDGRRCLAVAAENNGMLLISVVMGSESVYQADGTSAITVGGYKETSALLDAGFEGHKATQILYANQPIDQCRVDGGNCDLVVGTKEAVSSVVPSDTTAESLSYRFTIQGLSAPISKGQKITTMQIWSGNLCVGEADLVALNSVDAAILTDADPVEQKDTSDFAYIMIILLVGAVFIFVVFRFLKHISAFFTRRRQAQYRRSHRRSR